jgi:oligoendopeptidase F
MSEYQKGVLKKVSFDQELFEKELKKVQNWLLVDDLKEFVDWVLKTFSTMFSNLESKVEEFFSHLFVEDSVLLTN